MYFRQAKNPNTEDENLIDVFYRISKFLDWLIQKYVKSDYESGINENNYKIINDTDDLLDNDFEFFKGNREYLIKLKSELDSARNTVVELQKKQTTEERYAIIERIYGQTILEEEKEHDKRINEFLESKKRESQKYPVVYNG